MTKANIRAAATILKDGYGKHLSAPSVELLNVKALEALAGEPIAYRPEIEKTYSATDIAKETGVSRNRIGKLANAHNLKGDQYGIYVLDKSLYSGKQVPTFRYNEKGRAKLIELMKGES